MTPTFAAFIAPRLDYLALAPEIILTAAIVVAMIVDLIVDRHATVWASRIIGIGFLAALLPVIYLWVAGGTRVPMFDGAWSVDHFALVFKGLLLASAFVVMLMSLDYIGDGDYYEGEYSYLLACSVLGMIAMASARDLMGIFIALELLSIPIYLLAGWKKGDRRSNEASLKYFVLGSVSSGVMLYGMSLIYGVTGSLQLNRVAEGLAQAPAQTAPLVALAMFMVLMGFFFKVSAVPFHLWAPDTYQGAPTPITAFLSVASKTAGFVALAQLVLVGFGGLGHLWKPLFAVVAVLTMTIGNLTALKQTNVVRMLAYSSVAQAGYVLVPFAVADTRRPETVTASIGAIVVYLAVYTAMNLGAFAVVIAVTRRMRTGHMDELGGMFTYAPALAVMMAGFLFSLTGIPPFGGWYAKLAIVQSLFVAGGVWAVVLGCAIAVNSVLGFGYYGNLVRVLFFKPVPEGGSERPLRVKPAVWAAVAVTMIITLVSGIIPQVVAHLGEMAALR